MKRLFALVLAVVMIISMTACGTSQPAETTQAPTEAKTTAAAPAESKAPAAPVEFNGKIQAPFAITSCGQSPGATMLNVIASQAKLTSVCDNAMAVDGLPADTKTLIITMGTSGKGMGAAGTDVDMELARCTALAEAAHAAGMLVVGAHIEGMARRTDANDQASIDGILAVCDVVLVIEDSDSDGLFTKYCEENSKPLLKVGKALDAGSVME